MNVPNFAFEKSFEWVLLSSRRSAQKAVQAAHFHVRRCPHQTPKHNKTLIKRLATALIPSLLGVFMLVGNSGAATEGITAEQIQGTWVATWKSSEETPRIRKEIKILALGKQHLKVEFFGGYEYVDPSGETALNVGVAVGSASIEKSVIQFEPRTAAEAWGCKITMVVQRQRLVVSQQNECGFGSHVHAGGTYRRESSDKPTFDETFWNDR
jgi:hypothetical protein